MTSKLTLAEERKRSREHKKQREAYDSVEWPECVEDPTEEWNQRMKGRVFG